MISGFYIISIILTTVALYTVSSYSSGKCVILSLFGAILHLTGWSISVYYIVKTMRNINTGVIYNSSDNFIDLQFGNAVYISSISFILGIICFFVQLRSLRIHKRAKSVNSDTSSSWASSSNMSRASTGTYVH
jgi:hypothetical protein